MSAFTPGLLGLGIGGLNIGASLFSQSSAAAKQNAYLAAQARAANENYQNTIEAVVKDVGLQTDALARQKIETVAAQRMQLMQIGQEAKNTSSMYNAALAEAGVTGRSVQMLHDQFDRDVLDYLSVANRNISNFTAQMNRQAQSIYSRGQSIINQGYPSPLPPAASVDYFGSIAQGLTSGIGLGISAYGAGIGRQADGSMRIF